MSGADQVRERCYLIRKGGYYYRPNSQGYTTEASAAGRYTLDEAEKLTHPNGVLGPRDGLSFIHLDDLPTFHTAQSDALAVMVKAREALAGLLKVAKHGSPNADDRVKQRVSAVFAARTALADLDAAIERGLG